MCPAGLRKEPRGDPLGLIPFFRVVNIMAFKTYPAGGFYRLLCHLVTSVNSVQFFNVTRYELSRQGRASGSRKIFPDKLMGSSGRKPRYPEWFGDLSLFGEFRAKPAGILYRNAPASQEYR